MCEGKGAKIERVWQLLCVGWLGGRVSEELDSEVRSIVVCGLQSVWGCWAVPFPAGGSWVEGAGGLTFIALAMGEFQTAVSPGWPRSRNSEAARICLVPTRWVLWGPTGRHTFVKMPRLPGCPASCPPAQHNVAPGTVWAVQRRGCLQAEKQGTR